MALVTEHRGAWKPAFSNPTPATQAAVAAGQQRARRWLRSALLATIAVGIAWRLVRYLGGFPIWGDEAMLLLNLLDRDYAGLTQHYLLYNQVSAPLLFLWLEKTALRWSSAPPNGRCTWSRSLRGFATLWLFWHTCRSSFSPTVAGFAVAILAVSYYPVRHSCEVKPYAFDLLYAAVPSPG